MLKPLLLSEEVVESLLRGNKGVAVIIWSYRPDCAMLVPVNWDAEEVLQTLLTPTCVSQLVPAY